MRVPPRAAWFRLVFALLLLAGCDSSSHKLSFRSTDVTGAPFAKDFQLTDFDGQPRKLADFRGKVVVVFFGYTHCPDVCPTTMAELAGALKKLGADAAKVQVLFVTADPQRDTAAVLKQYVTAFDPTFVGLYGTPEEIQRTAKDFKVIIQKNEGADANNYTVDHSSGTFIFDTKGALRLFVSYGQGADVFAHDISELLKAQ